MADGSSSAQRRHPDNGIGAVTAEVSPGELIDKITILEIKTERMADPAKRDNVRFELDRLTAVRDEALPNMAELGRLTTDLKAVNARLWDIEDDIRGCDRRGAFGDGFIALARAVYRTNDQRAAIKARINRLLGARIREEKSYAPY
jgi:3-methyladenine DNA glycosylase/8-oxoguanine DNA glycosylase